MRQAGYRGVTPLLHARSIMDEKHRLFPLHDMLNCCQWGCREGRYMHGAILSDQADGFGTEGHLRIGDSSEVRRSGMRAFFGEIPGEAD